MKKGLFPIILIFVLLAAVGCGAKEEVEVVVEESYIPVEVVTVEEGILEQKVVLNGTVQASSQVLVLPKVPGKIEEKFVKIGDAVLVDDPLFKINKEDVLDQVKQAEKSLSLARVNYTMTKDRYNDSQSTLARNKTLYDNGAISKSQYEQILLASNDAQLKSSRLQLEQAQLSYNQVKDSVDDTSIKASIDGIVTQVNGNIGDFVGNTSPVLTIMDMEQVKLQFSVSESIINKISEDTKITVVIPAISDEEVVTTIEYISPAVGQNSKLYPVSLCIENPELIIKPGMFAKIIVDISSDKKTVLVPDETILFEPEGLFVYKLVDDIPEKIYVEAGDDNGFVTEILSGLSAGDEIIIKGQQYIKRDSMVKVLRGDD